MLRLARLISVLSAVLLAGAGCSSGGVAGGSSSTAPPGSVSTVAASSTTGEAGATPTGAVPVEPASPTTLPFGSARCPETSGASCEADTVAGEAYLEARVAGGSFGFRFARPGGEVIASLNPEEAFYPASSIKVLLHLHALRWVSAQPDRRAALATPIPVYENSCTAEGAMRTEPLEAVLRQMMIESDNQRANAILDHFGREAINATAAEVAGLSDTALAHRFGCGGPANDPANRSTALDLSRVYERVALGDVLDAEGFAAFAGLMLGPMWPSLTSAVAAEGRSLGLAPETVTAFGSAVELVYKAGWWETNLSIGGLLRLPTGLCEGDARREYAFAVFVSGADAVAPGFDVSDVAAVVLREEIEAALAETAQSPCAP